MLLASFLVAAVPASAGTLSWTPFSPVPSSTGNVLAEGDILDIAVAADGETIYAATISSAITANLEQQGSNTATWSTTQAHSGSTSVELDYDGSAADMAYVEFTPPTGITLAEFVADIDDYGFYYFKTVAGGCGPEGEFRFTDGGSGWVRVTVEAALYDYITDALTINAWNEITFSDTEMCQYFGDGSDGVSLTGDDNFVPSALIALIVADSNIDADTVASVGAWEMDLATVSLGWCVGEAQIGYIDDVTIAGTTYNLEGTSGSSADGEAFGGHIYKSTNAGETWSSLTNPACSSVSLIAVAPDDADIVVVAGDNNKVYITINGGTTWGDLAFTGADVINDIAISAESAGIHYIAVAGKNDTTGAKVFTYNAGGTPATWRDASVDCDGFWAKVDTDSTATAVAYSPNFPSDLVMLVVTEGTDATKDYVKLEIFSENLDKWNAATGTFDGYPVTIVDETGTTGLISGSITLDPGYLGSDDAMRLAFIGLTITDTSKYNGIYRADDTTAKALKTGSAVQIHSVAYNGLTLVAGRFDSNICYYSTNPTATTPTVDPTRSLKRPGINKDNVNEMTVVAWAGDDVVAGTSGEESAFAVSTNDGKSFSDISLIDTDLANLSDVAVSPDGSKVYLATDDGGDFSLWLKASSWKRVLAVPEKDTFIVRFAPDDPDVIYVADKGDTTIYYSADGGMERWQMRISKYGVADLAIESDGDVAYVLTSAGKVSKSTTSGFTWGTEKSTKLTGGNMVASIGKDALIVGSTNGYVSYSTDGNSSWTKIGKAAGGDNIVVTASSLADEGYIYVGTHETEDSYLYRWQIGVSSKWTKMTTDMTPTDAKGGIPANYQVFGIALQGDILYANTASGTDGKSMTFRTLNPTGDPTVYWSTRESTALFDVGPQALKVGGGNNKLWAINSEGPSLYSFTDTLVDVVPTLTAPKDGFLDKVNPISGYATDITFSWKKPSSEVDEYNLYIYDDDGNRVFAKSVASTSTSVSCVVGRDLSDTSTSSTFTFQPGETYSWKVRVSSAGPIYSGYSEVREFSIEEAEVAPPVVIGPAPTPEITVEVPEITVEVPPTPTPAPAAAPIAPVYLWAIIAIGAVLVIALIILVIRTRRVA